MRQPRPSAVPSPRLSGNGHSAPAARVRLAASVSTSSQVDGAWWPHTTDLVAELPALVEAVHARSGHVALVGYHLHGWDRAAPQVDIAGETIWLEGFIDDDPRTVIVIGSSGRRLTLLVVAPDTPRTEALEALAAASDARLDAGSGSGSDAGNARSLDEVVARLASREGQTDERRTRTIERWVHEAARQFIGAPVQAYVPLLVEHIVREQITDARHVRRRGSDGSPSAAALRS